MYKEWQVKSPAKDKVAYLEKKAGISNFLAAALVNRGIEYAEEAKKFLAPQKQPLHDPFLMKGMQTAVERIMAAVERKEKIVIYGDYDVDGMTAVAIMMKALRLAGGDVSFFIPERLEGYGFNQRALQQIAEDGCDLLISVDCGISAVEDTASFSQLYDIIITDHHLPGEKIPQAVAVLNPHQADCTYPCKDLCGAGVAFKLCQALWQTAGFPANETEFLSLAALATVADVVPLQDENRTIVAKGLAAMKDTTMPGLRALLDVSGLSQKEKITAESVGFILGPRLNAAGRMASATIGAELLLSQDSVQALELAERLNALNQERQRIEQYIMALAEEQLKNINVKQEKVLVVAGEKWHRGVIGIVASRLVEKYYRPVIVISLDNGVGSGSCRSIENFNIHDALASCADCLIQYGGHAKAAGLSVQAEKISLLRRRLTQYAQEKMRPEDYIPRVPIEFLLPPEKIDFSLLADIDKLEPFGEANPKPSFGCRNIWGEFARSIGNQGKHLKFKLIRGSETVEAVSWNNGDKAQLVNSTSLDIVYKPQRNEWQGVVSVQLLVEDFFPAQRKVTSVTRDSLIFIYKYLKRNRLTAEQAARPAVSIHFDLLQEGFVISLENLQSCFKIFSELGIVAEGKNGVFLLPPPEKKIDLRFSPTFCRMQDKGANA